jgi:ABC-type glycerol-3-phosphate transport system substrate-binding protein
VYDWVPNTRKDKLMTMGGWGMTIPKGAAHVKEAFRIIEYFTGLEAAQHIYNKNGWLNGNLNTMRRLDTGNNKGIMWFMQALSDANRLRTPENISIMSEIRAQFKTYNWNMCKGLISPEQALIELQKILQGKLDEVSGRK